MHLIHELYDKAMEELEEAEEYAELALELKPTKMAIAERLTTLSEEEAAHADKLMGIIAVLVEEKKHAGQLTERDTVRCEVLQEMFNKAKAGVKTVQVAYKM